MSKQDFDREMLPSTRFAEGWYNGLKMTICHALTYGIYYSKDLSITNGTSFKHEYLKNLCKASLFYPLLFSTIYATRQYVLLNRDTIIYRLHQTHPLFKKKPALIDIIIYFLIYFPLGTAVNYIGNGRIVRGTFSLTLGIALFMRTVEGF